MVAQPDRQVIDVHTHFAPDAAEAMARIMDTNGLARVVNLGMLEELSIPFEEGLRALRRVLGARMVYFATPDFRDNAPGFGERMAQDLERKVHLGAGGLKIFKDLGLRHRDDQGRLIPVDDPRLDPLWAKAGELGVPVLIHTADPLAFFGPLDEHNERWEELQLNPDWHFGRPGFPGHDELLEQRNRVLARHPGTTFIGAHLGEYPENLPYVDACLERYPNFCVDVCARIGEIGRHPAEEARAFFIKHQDRVLFGTDLVLEPGQADKLDLAEIKRFYDLHWAFFETDEAQIEHPGYPIQGRWKVDAIGLPPDVLDKLYRRNALRVVPALSA
jgi:predicted TIM-barrel fold metal-dependent hydrolase